MHLTYLDCGNSPPITAGTTQFDIQPFG